MRFLSTQIASRVVHSCCLVFGMLLAVSALAQPFPNRPVFLVVPYPAGGSSDFAARLVSQSLSENLGQPVIVENRGGGVGTVGTVHVKRSAPDGYTLLLGNVGLLAIAPHLYPNIPYDSLKDFSPVTNLVGDSSLLVVHPSLPVHSVAELIAMARTKSGGLNHGSAGMGTTSHLNLELFNLMAKVSIVNIPYKGGGQMIADLLSGQVPIAFSDMATLLPMVKSGKLRALAMTALTRSPLAPNVPTLDESGLPGFESNSWNGILAPAGTPREIVAKLNEEIIKVLRSPDVTERIRIRGLQAIGDSPEAFAAYIEREVARWGSVIRQANIKVE